MARPSLDDKILVSGSVQKKPSPLTSLERRRKLELERSVQSDRMIGVDKSEERSDSFGQGTTSRQRQESENQTPASEIPLAEEPVEEEANNPSTRNQKSEQDEPEDEDEENEEEPLTVPELVGKNPNSAEQELAQFGLGANIMKVGEGQVSAVVNTEPGAGTEVEKGAIVTLYVTEKNEDEENEEDEDDESDAEENPEELGEGSEGVAPEAGAAEGAGATEVGVAAGAGVGAGAAAGGAVATTTPVWGIILAIALGILALIFLVVIMFAAVLAKCNEDSWTGVGARVGSTVASKLGLISDDVCKKFTFNFSGGSSGGAGATGNFGLSDASARRQLTTASITVNASQPQTSLEGISQAVITETVNFKQACDIWAGNRGPCTVIVTGGTETTGGHAPGRCSHLSGDKIDIDDTPLVNQFIEATFGRSGSRGSDPRYRSGSGVSYVKESNHWDIGGVGCD